MTSMRSLNGGKTNAYREDAARLARCAFGGSGLFHAGDLHALFEHTAGSLLGSFGHHSYPQRSQRRTVTVFRNTAMHALYQGLDLVSTHWVESTQWVERQPGCFTGTGNLAVSRFPSGSR